MAIPALVEKNDKPKHIHTYNAIVRTICTKTTGALVGQQVIVFLSIPLYFPSTLLETFTAFKILQKKLLGTTSGPKEN